MKILFKLNNASSFRLAVASLLITLCTSAVFAQQIIGTFPYMNGGFEGQNVGALGTAVSSTFWSRQSQSGASASIVTTSPRTGVNYATVTNVSTVSRGLQSPQLVPFVAGSTLTKSTQYVVQYWIRNAATVDQFQVSPNTNGTSGTSYSTAATMAINSGWTKYTNVLTTSSSTVTSSGIAIIGRSAVGTFDIDDVVIYAGSAKDETAPNAPTLPVISAVAATQQTISWTAASGGYDGGGYMVVRGTSDPTTTPNANGIYAIGSNVTTGQKVVYLGTNTSFIDTELSPSTTYYYRIYTVDKAFNYSTAASVSGTTATAGYATEPTTQSSSISFTSVTSSGMTINWTAGNGTNSLVVVRAAGSIDSSPIDGSTYTPNTTYGSGSQIGLGNGSVVSLPQFSYATQVSGNYSVYNGIGNSVTVTGLSKGTTYYVKVYSYNGTAGTENYLTSNPASSSQDIVGSSITSAQSGTWATTTTWTGGVVPTAYDNVVIQNGHTVDLQSSNAAVYNVTINSGGKLFTTYSASTYNLQMYGTKLQCDGTLGDPSAAVSSIFVDFAGNLTISGSGSINIYKMRPVSGYSNIGVTFASNTNLTYSSASIQTDNTNNDNVTFNVNSGVTLAFGGNMNTTSSSFNNGSANTTWNINGTVNVPNGYFSPLVNSGKTFTCNINNGGSLSVLNLQVTQPGGASPTINVASGGTFTVIGTNCDLSGPVLTVIQGAGTFATSATVGVKISNASGLNTSTGPIRTSTINFDPGTSFTYGYYTTQSSTTTSASTAVTLSASNSSIVVGMGVSGTGIATGTTVSAVSGTSLTLSQNATAAGTNTLTFYSTTLPAQTTGNGLPSTVGALTILNPAGVTLTNSTTANGTLSLTAGTLNVGSGNTLTLKGTRAGTGYIDGTGGTIAYSGSSSSQTASLLQNVNNLIVNNTASSTPGLVFQSSTTVNGTLTLQAGLIFNGSPNPNITLANGANIVCSGGGFSSGAPIFGTSVNVTYNGASAQTTGYELPTSSTVLNNLTINNSAGVSLNADAQVNGVLTLTSGKLSLGAKNLTIGASGSISGASASNYIVTDGSGKLTQSVGAGSTVVFPVGASASGSYDPASVTPTDAASVAVGVSSTLSHTSAGYIYLNPREWTITPSATSSTVVALTPSALNDLSTSHYLFAQYGVSDYNYLAATNSSGTFTATVEDFSQPIVTGSSDFSVGLIKNGLTAHADVYATNGSIVVENAMGNTVEIYASTGKLIQIAKCNSDNQRFTTGKGMFIVKNGSKVNKIVVR